MLPEASVTEGDGQEGGREREKNLAISSSVDTVDPWMWSPRVLSSTIYTSLQKSGLIVRQPSASLVAHFCGSRDCKRYERFEINAECLQSSEFVGARYGLREARQTILSDRIRSGVLPSGNSSEVPLSREKSWRSEASRRSTR